MNAECHYLIVPYSAEFMREWDDFVSDSRNGTFMLKRGYMDYHSDRFVDRSLMIYRSYADDTKLRLVGLFAACDGGDGCVCAHAGLTYGGLIMPVNGIDGSGIVDVIAEICRYYTEQGYRRLVYKAIPHIYHRFPSEDDIYALFRCNATLSECNLSAIVDLYNRLPYNKNSRRHVRSALQSGVIIEESNDYARYWDILQGLLSEKYNTLPVHSLSEIEYLAGRFPDNIRLVTAKDGHGDVIAGTVLYITPTCVHAQYIAASTEGKRVGALALLFDEILAEYCSGVRYFDFGISNENHGLYLNEGLLRQKYGFGGRGLAYNIFTIEL